LAKKRRAASLYANLSTSDKKALTPDFGSAAVVKIKPDAKFEKTLFEMLLSQQRRYARLLKEHQRLLTIMHERKVKRSVLRLVPKIPISHNPNPKNGGK
jgi:hypothetical protein